MKIKNSVLFCNKLQKVTTVQPKNDIIFAKKSGLAKIFNHLINKKTDDTSIYSRQQRKHDWSFHPY